MNQVLKDQNTKLNNKNMSQIKPVKYLFRK